jgi:hypothetical protein
MQFSKVLSFFQIKRAGSANEPARFILGALHGTILQVVESGVIVTCWLKAVHNKIKYERDADQGKIFF